MIKRIFLFVVLLLPVVVLAQTVADPNQEFMEYLIKSLGGTKGMTTLGIIALVVQLLMKFLETSWFNKLVPLKVLSWKLPAVSLLTIISGVLALVIRDGMSWSAALLHSTTLSAGMVFAHQWLSWFKAEPKAELPK